MWAHHHSAAEKAWVTSWNGVDTPEVLRGLKPGQYAILPFEPPNEVLQSKKEAA